jgi:hypothetical protein
LVNRAIDNNKRLILIDNFIDIIYVIEVQKELQKQKDIIESLILKIKTNVILATSIIILENSLVDNFIKKIIFFDKLARPLQNNMKQRGLKHDISSNIISRSLDLYNYLFVIGLKDLALKIYMAIKPFINFEENKDKEKENKGNKKENKSKEIKENKINKKNNNNITVEVFKSFISTITVIIIIIIFIIFIQNNYYRQLILINIDKITSKFSIENREKAEKEKRESDEWMEIKKKKWKDKIKNEKEKMEREEWLEILKTIKKEEVEKVKKEVSKEKKKKEKQKNK